MRRLGPRLGPRLDPRLVALRGGASPLGVAVLLLTLAACATVGSRDPGLDRASPGPSSATSPQGSVAAARTLVVVSLDGFRADYLGRFPARHLEALAARGVRAERLVPSFPSKTYPNHFTLMTGQRPEHHGIVANDMLDPERSASFTLADRDAVADGRWWQAEPLWVTAERLGVRTAPFDWPGTEAAIGGVRPTWWRPFDATLSDAARVEALLALLALPGAERPRLLTLYFEHVDDAGHEHGPDSPAVAAAVARVDAAVGELLAGLERLGLAAETDVVVVSDHGMAATPPGQTIALDELVDLERARVVSWSPVLALWPVAADLDAVATALHGAHPHLAVYRREELPARLHYRDHPRIPPLLALADEGWRITTRARAAAGGGPRGEHGYDPALPSMGALFVAAGPSFLQGVVVPPFDNVAVYPLFCAALGIAPLAGDWSAAELPAVLARPAAP